MVRKAKNSIAPLIKRRAPLYSEDGMRAISVNREFARKPFRLALALCFLLLPFLIMNGIRKNVHVAEWWTTHIARGFERAVGTLTSILPLSVFELLVAFVIVLAVYFFVRLVIDLSSARWKRILSAALGIGIAAVCVLDLYMLSMGFGYYRAALPLNQSGAEYDAVRAKTAATYFLDDYNALSKKLERDENGNTICPYTFSELNELIAKEYERAAVELNAERYISPYTPNGKAFVNSWLLSDLLLTGITFLPTGEANVNAACPMPTVTATLVHELAHAKGVQREGDANILAQYLLLSSDDDYLRYCGYYDSFSYLEQAVWLAGDREGYRELMNAVDPLITKEHKNEREYWASQPDIIGSISNFFNDLYLKLNGANNGVGSYNDGAQQSVKPVVDPETGENKKDENGNDIVKPVYSKIQKIYFYLYETRL